jgi:hypothetical protein
MKRRLREKETAVSKNRPEVPLSPPRRIEMRDRLRKQLAAVGVRKVTNCRPGRTHRPAVWMTLLGVFGIEAPDGTVHYVDFDLARALTLAGLAGRAARRKADLRVASYVGPDEFLDGKGQPHDGMAVLWAVR